MRAALTLCCFLQACAGSQPGPPDHLPPPARQCSSALAGAVGVFPLKNKTNSQVELDGSDDLLMTEMADSGCFTLVERDRLSVLVDEMKLCDDANPDKAFMDCSTFAKKGHLLGMKTAVLGDLAFFEPNVKGADLALKLPGIGGIDAGTSYSALAINLRAVDVETGEARASVMVHALVRADEAGINLSTGPFTLRAQARERTPMGEALQGMLRDGVRRLKTKLGE
jgi:curli biogenesis system outer membrane secretion channel CsgG